MDQVQYMAEYEAEKNRLELLFYQNYKGNVRELICGLANDIAYQKAIIREIQNENSKLRLENISLQQTAFTLNPHQQLKCDHWVAIQQGKNPNHYSINGGRYTYNFTPHGCMNR